MKHAKEADVEEYVRKVFPVSAVLVTEENLESAADFCAGEIRTTADGQRFIKVRVIRPTTARQSRAFVGDWILYSPITKGYKVYTESAFRSGFEKTKV
jgi:hypothetical protein